MMHVNANWYEGEWNDLGAVITIAGFEGVALACPRCAVALSPGEHRCGDRIIAELPKKAKRATKP